MRNSRISPKHVRPLAALGLLLAATQVSAAEPEHLKTLAKKCDEFAWSLEIESRPPRDKTAPLYGIPQTGHFRPSYARDRTNQKVQTWAQYWDWVETFYRGNLFDQGWKARSKRLAASSEMRAYFNILGRVIAAEWAKDNDVRTIDTADVRRWARALETASADDATGEKRLSTLRTITDQVVAKLCGA